VSSPYGTMVPPSESAPIQMGPGGPVTGPPIDVPAPQFFERIYQPLYDSVSITAAATSTPFFNTSPTNILFGNIERPNTLPRPQAFACRAISVYYDMNVLAADAVLLSRSGCLVFTLNDRKQFQLPITFLGGAGGLATFGRTDAAAVANVTNGYPSMAFVHWLPIPIVISEEEVFQVRIDWLVALTGLTATRVWVAMWGVLRRKPTGQ